MNNDQHYQKMLKKQMRRLLSAGVVLGFTIQAALSQGLVGNDKLVQIAVSDIDRIGIRAMKKGESFRTHKTMSASVKLVVLRFANDPKSLYSLIDLSIKMSNALQCDCTTEMHCTAYRSACIFAIHQLRDLKTPEATSTLQSVSKIVLPNSEVSRVLRDVLNPGSAY